MPTVRLLAYVFSAVRLTMPSPALVLSLDDTAMAIVLVPRGLRMPVGIGKTCCRPTSLTYRPNCQPLTYSSAL